MGVIWKHRLFIIVLMCMGLIPIVSAKSPGQFDDGTVMTTLERITFISYSGIGLLFLATAGFLVMERRDVARRHRSSIGIGAVICGIAGFHYLSMLDAYLAHGAVPTDFRYTDWVLTVPLMAVLFALLAGRESYTKDRFLMIPGLSVPGVIIFGSLIMMISGYIGQMQIDQAIQDGSTPPVTHWYWFVQGLIGFVAVLSIVGSPLNGAYGIDDSRIQDESIRHALLNLRRLMLFGWLIYPIGYIVGAQQPSGEDPSLLMMLVYNMADLVNKLGFVIIVLIGAKNTPEALSQS